MSAPTVCFSVQADETSDASAWLELARKVEALGFDALYVADHPGVSASPFAALAAAAASTSTLKLGTYVCNIGVREPVALASDAATVDVISNGRLILGLGAGHTPVEWTMNGSDYPSARARVGRLGEMVGGNGKQLLRFAASHADIVNMTGLGRTLEDGHDHTADWSRESIDERVAIVRDGAGDRDVVSDALVQQVEITSIPSVA